MDRLSGCSILEVGEYVAVPYAGKLLSDIGATVTKIERPKGDVAREVGPFVEEEPGVERSEFFGYLNTGKRSVRLPPGDATAADFIRDFIEHADVDVVIEEDLLEYGIDPGELVEDSEGLSVVSVSGFGMTGPFQEYEAPEIVAWAESGHMNKMGYPDSPPARLRIKAADYWAGQVAAISAMTALFDGVVQGAGGQHIDLAEREVGTSSLEYFVAGYSWSGDPSQRTGQGYPAQGDRTVGKTIYEAKDGYISASVGGRWETFCEEFLERPELIEDERFETRAARIEHRDEMLEILEEYLRGEEKWDLFRRLQEHGFPSAVTSTPADLAEFDHLKERDFWEDVELPSGDEVTMPGFPFLVDEERPAQERAPQLGEHDGEVYDALGYEYLPSSDTLRETGPAGSSRSVGGSAETDDDVERPLPLSGVKVLDFSWVYAGPHASRLMAALGADVVKVESEYNPDGIRGGFSFQFDAEPTSNVSAYYNEVNQGKRHLNLDLRTDRGREIALELMEEADVVMENYSPNFMDRIGLDYETIREANPEIVYLSMPGWGKTGPAKSYRAYGLIIQSMAGLDWISGFPEDPPTTSGMSWPDPVNAYMGLFSALVALYDRERTGEGAYVESALFEVTVSMMHKPLSEYMNNGRMPERMGNRDEDRRYVQGAYPCEGEDRWAVVAVESDAEWERLCEVMDRPDLLADERFESQSRRLSNHDAVDEAIAEWTSERAREEVRTRLQAHDVPAGIVADERDLVEYDPQMRVREYFVRHDHPEVGERTFQGFPFESSLHDIQFTSRAPLFGEHTEEVLKEWLGMAPEEIEAAEAAEALF